ncbi:MAG TPA: lysylphosphatidylglycerol synthase transmembrane domain-containing protein [Gemmatimonadales bacterium]|nr:lysylphosphatidylglycerol synthase transmembrane domain-containing protein [Gemmatimonadales bacterium]
MSRFWQPVLALLGGAVLVVIITSIGPATIAAAVRQAGWIILLILALQGACYALNAWAWWLVMPKGPDRPAWREVFRISVIGFAFNFVTPIVNAGGEPYRIAALTPRLGVARATGATLLYVLVHAVSSIAFWLTAILLSLLVLPWSPAPAWVLGCVAAVLVAALAAVLSGHRDGIAARVTRLAAWLRLRRLAGWLQARQDGIVRVDAEIVQAWHRQPGSLIAAITIDIVSRALNAMELLLVAVALGVAMEPATAIAMWGYLALTVNLFFFLPWELGSREGGIFGLSHAAGLPAEFAGLAMVVGRIREVAWAGIGMAWLAVTGEGRREKGEG